MDARSAAAQVVAQVLEGSSLSVSLAAALPVLPERERGFTQELSYGALRWGPRLQALLDRLLRKPLRDKDRELRALLWVGLYQLIYTRVPEYAAVAGSVAASRDLNKAWAAGLVNAVLRGFQKRRDALLAEVDRDDAAACAHPHWWLERLRAGRPGEWRAIVAANNERPPMTLRVNRCLGTRDDYLRMLAAAGLRATPALHTDAGIMLDRPLDVAQLPGFKEGRVSVQDAAAQLAACVLAPAPGERVLDACAAPGGKTGHVLELQPALAELVAVESDAVRMVRVKENLDRLGLRASLVVADAGDVHRWWDDVPFDRVLLDAPCSGSGVIRRHPDIKYLRRPADIAVLAAEQRRLLAALWPLVKRGGMLLYVTCSVLPEEDELQAQSFLEAHDDAREEPLAAQWGRPLRHGRLILPGTDGMDGFYYASFKKT
ncbi:MAG: 16S rRNA (cytosine(967)-C(5))-methyltransferase RsmB [Gammaproteobacteria bacterium]